MPKRNDDGFDLDNLQILQDIDLSDEMLQKGGKVDSEDEEDDTNEDVDDDAKSDDESDDDEGSKKPDPKKKAPASKPITSVDLTDEMIESGLRIASGKKDVSTKTPPKGTDDSDDDNDSDDPANKDKKKPVDQNNPFSVHYNMMVEAGVWEELEGFDGTKEKYLEAQDFNAKRKLDEALDEYLDEAFENNPEGKAVGMKLLKHLARGGRVSDFTAVQAPAELDFDALDDKDEARAEEAAEDIIRSYYRDQKWKKEQINSKIATLKKTGALVEEAKIIEEPYKEQLETKATEEAEYLEKVKSENQKANKTLNTSILNIIEKGHAFGAIKVGKDKKEKVEYQNYIFQPTDKRVSQFALDLQAHLRDPEFILYTAVAMRNKLHKNPTATADPAKGKKEALDEVEDKLSKALLNKKLDDKSSDTGTGGKSSGAGASRPQHKFNLDEAQVLD